MRISPSTDGVALWRRPTRWDVLAYGLPVLFCLFTACSGVFLFVRFGTRYLLVVIPGIVLAFVFIAVGIRSVGRIRVSAQGINLPDGTLIAAAAVSSISAQIPRVNNYDSDDENEHGNVHRYGVKITEKNVNNTKIKHVVLYGLLEKERIEAAEYLKEALQLHCARSDLGTDSCTSDTFTFDGDKKVSVDV